jgi:hypothetical protein
MKNARLCGILCYAAPIVVAFAVVTAAVAPASADLIDGRTLLFQDNFTAAAQEGINDGLAGRQSGLLVDASGAISYAPAGWYAGFLATDGVSGTSATHPNTLAMPSATVAALDRNLNGGLARGGMVVQFLLDPKIGNYASFSLCMNDSLSINSPGAGGYAGWPDLIDGGNPLPRVTVGFLGDPTYGNLLGLWGPDFAGGFSGWSAVPVSLQDGKLHQITVVCTDPTDNNPFDGVGGTNLAFYVDGNHVTDFSKGGGGYANNFIAPGNYVWAGQFAEYGNLQVYGAPEPGMIAMLGMAGALIAWFKFRKR